MTNFWNLLRKHVEIRPSCWNWRGSVNDGYAIFSVQCDRKTKWKRYRAHRFIYELMRGPVPLGLVLDHLCRNRACVNPEHLEVVPNKVNVLRGVGLTAQNARKTHCKNGHEFTPANTRFIRPRGRGCKTCDAQIKCNARHKGAGK